MVSAVMEQRPGALARAAQGDADSFSYLIQPLLDPAYRLAAVMLNDRPAAEDAVQEASLDASAGGPSSGWPRFDRPPRPARSPPR